MYSVTTTDPKTRQVRMKNPDSLTFASPFSSFINQRDCNEIHAWSRSINSIVALMLTTSKATLSLRNIRRKKEKHEAIGPRRILLFINLWLLRSAVRDLGVDCRESTNGRSTLSICELISDP
mmetsp:Transcript_11669/g.19234  ORF Transcript_11669/g.19234 Transcript_11669/m.19234 type:complete len:122 (-) Transcript_11669:725-1090(-)